MIFQRFFSVIEKAERSVDIKLLSFLHQSVLHRQLLNSVTEIKITGRLAIRSETLPFREETGKGLEDG